jgi:hypothetical protein
LREFQTGFRKYPPPRLSFPGFQGIGLLSSESADAVRGNLLPLRTSDGTEKANVHFEGKNPDFQIVVFTLLYILRCMCSLAVLLTTPF